MEKKKSKPSETVDRELIINGMKIHVNIVFKDSTTLEKALYNIISGKLS